LPRGQRLIYRWNGKEKRNVLKKEAEQEEIFKKEENAQL
jgi:hypothetical protein